MNRLKEIIFKTKYELSLFAALCTNFLLFFTKEELMSDILYPLHLVDVKIGLLSRTLTGSLTGLLWEHPTKENVFFFHLCVVIITFALTALFLGRCVKQADEKTGNNLFMLSLIIAVLPYGFKTYVNLFELLDIYWVMTIVLIMLFADNKKTAYLIPLLIFTGLWVHYSFLLAFMPVIYIMYFNRCVKEKSKPAYIHTAVMIAVSVGATAYFMFTLRSFNVISFEEFTQYLIAKAGDKITNFERHIGLGFRPYEDMHKLQEFLFVPENIPEPVKAFLGNLAYTFIDSSPLAILADFILVSPIAAFFISIWKKTIRTAEDKKEKFIYFLCLITPLVQVFSCFTSSDTSRWLSLLVISQLFILSLFVKEKASPVCSAFNGIMHKLSEHKAVLISVILFYMSIVFVW